MGRASQLTVLSLTRAGVVDAQSRMGNLSSAHLDA